MFPLNFGQKMEVWVKMLTLILVSVHTNSVMVHRLVLPLWMRLDVEELHERVKLDIVVFVGELLSALEVSVTI